MRLNEQRATASRRAAGSQPVRPTERPTERQAPGGSAIAASRIARAPERAVPKSQPPKPQYGARSVGAYVPRVTKSSFEKFGFATATLMTEWPAIVGADLARMTSPDRVKWPRNDGVSSPDGDDAGHGPRDGATLVLRVDGPRALEIQYKTRQIIDRINAYFGYAAIGTIRILQAPLTVMPGTAATKRLSPARPVEAPSALAAVECAELRDALTRLHAGLTTRSA
jgi:hypothetical protein